MTVYMSIHDVDKIEVSEISKLSTDTYTATISFISGDNEVEVSVFSEKWQALRVKPNSNNK